MKLLLDTYARRSSLTVITYGYIEKLQVGMAESDEHEKCVAYSNDFMPMPIHTCILPWRLTNTRMRHTAALYGRMFEWWSLFFLSSVGSNENGVKSGKLFNIYMSTASFSLNWVFYDYFSLVFFYVSFRSPFTYYPMNASTKVCGRCSIFVSREHTHICRR